MSAGSKEQVLWILTDAGQPAAVKALNSGNIVPHAGEEIHEDKPATQVHPSEEPFMQHSNMSKNPLVSIPHNKINCRSVW